MVTLQDIASRVGVSHTLVSCIINGKLGKIRVSEARRQEVLKVAAEMGYIPNRSARTLATRLNQSLGLIVNYQRFRPLSIEASAYVMSILSGINEACSPLGFHCVYDFADLQSPTAFEMPSFAAERSVDGVIVAGYIHPEVEAKLLAQKLPIVHVGSNVNAESQILSLAADMEGAATRLMDRAAAAGIGAVHLFLPNGPGPRKISAAWHKHARLAHSGLQATSHHSMSSTISLNEAYEHGLQLAKRRQPPRLVLAQVSNAQALYAGLVKGGLTTPDAVELVFFASEAYFTLRIGLELLTPAIIELPNRKVSRLLATTILDRIYNKKEETLASIDCDFHLGETAPSLALETLQR